MLCRVTYDPNYHPDTLYASTKLFSLLYDEIFMWYPVQKESEPYIDTNELLELINLGIITPIGESNWWDKQLRRNWPSFFGEWSELDEQIVKSEGFLKFKDLINDEKLLREKVENLAKLNSQDAEFRNYVRQLGVLPYKHNLRTYEPSNWFARCFHSHRLISEKLSSYELVPENHQDVWKYLVKTTVVEQLKNVSESERKITELLKNSQNIEAIIKFMDDQKLYLPKNLTVNEILEFREEGASEEFRKFLERAYGTAQGRYDFDFKEQLLIDFNRLSKDYKRKREITVVTLSSLLTGPIVGLASTQIVPQLGPIIGTGIGASIGACVAANWRTIKNESENIYDQVIGKYFSSYCWVYHLLKFK